jgi:hypothetical protein
MVPLLSADQKNIDFSLDVLLFSKVGGKMAE